MRIAIYGYDSIVGNAVLEELESSSLQVDDLIPLSPIAAEYDAVSFRGKNYLISFVDDFDFVQADVAIFLTTKDESERLITQIQETNCIVIDYSHLYAGLKEVPLVMKELNPYDVVKVLEKKLASVPYACSNAIALSLNPLHDEYGIKRATITALIAASEHGELGTQTLAKETTLLLNGSGVDVIDFPAQLAFNLHTRIGKVSEEYEGLSEYEHLVKAEVSSLLDPFSEGMSLTCLQAPIFYGHTLSINVELEEDTSVTEIENVFKNCEYIALEQADELVTPVSCAELDNKLFIARIRKIRRNCFDFTVVIDNMRQGAASYIVNLLQLIQQHK